MDAQDLMKIAAEFHGHTCPGLAIGVMAAKYVLDHDSDFSVDEELVAMVENNNCSVDGLQALLGTTFAKGTLITKDIGKNNYTIFNRLKQKAVKLSLRDDIFSDNEGAREEKIAFILASSHEELFEIRETGIPSPECAPRQDSIICYNCGEPTMDTQTKELDGVKLCAPCYEQEKINRK